MKKILVLIVFVTSLGYAESPKSDWMGRVGRFQLYEGRYDLQGSDANNTRRIGQTMFRLDTVTGKVWMFEPV
jgi:hypothetical protein